MKILIRSKPKTKPKPHSPHYDQSTPEQQLDEHTSPSINKLVGETLSNNLDVPEGSFTGTGGQEVYRLVHTSQR
ncbi:hypothetical protein SAY86_023499 [Trapa natans]|uniref:Uncharacterized protein n=1 Tax=Trapa natans TaxID=22666 RepID=A0AAN7LXE2_TRANT|nr:hypothetical protein SAY86_023499 [Trapa natans]